MRVLIIDDNVDDITLMKRHLVSCVQEVTGVTSLEAASEKMTGTSYDCVIVDYLMPGMSGVDVIKALRGQGLACPIVMVTGCHDRLVATKSIQEGAQNYFPKECIENEPQLFQECVMHTANQQMLETEARLSLIATQMRAVEERINSCVRSRDGRAAAT